MHLVLDPAQDAAHGEWLRRTPGAYEWWYFDAISDDGAWALACIWFLGNPFSPYYRHAARREAADPFTHNALFLPCPITAASTPTISRASPAPKSAPTSPARDPPVRPERPVLAARRVTACVWPTKTPTAASSPPT